MEKVFRRILSRAGIVVGYRHICRRCAGRREPQVVKAPDAEIRRCAKCNMRMWPSPVPRRMRFHDVRHTTITLLLRLKIPMHLVQRIARHSNIRLTVDTYGDLDVSDLRDALEVLGEATGVVPDALEAEVLARSDSLTAGPMGSKRCRRAKKEGPGPWRFLRRAWPLSLERNTEFETATFALARRSPLPLMAGRSHVDPRHDGGA